MTYWKITAVQGTQTKTRTVHNVYDAAMVPAQMECEGWHCTVTEHNDGQSRETYRTENDPIQAGLDKCQAKLDARVPSVGF